MRVALDFSPGVSQPAGIGRYARELVSALVSFLGKDLVLFYGRVSHPVGCPPAGATLRRLPLSPVWLTRLWHRVRLPLFLEMFVGHVDVVHGIDFLLPPTRSPGVVTIHDLSYLIVPELGHPRLVQFLAATVPRTLASARRIVTVSEAVRTDLIRLYRVDPARVHVIYHGVGATFRPVERAQGTPLLASLGIRDPYIVAVGTVEPRKGYPILLRAVERLLRERPDLQLVIVGSSGWLSERLEEAILQAVRRDWVVWLRRIDDDLLAAIYSGARAFVTASYYEGFNLPLLEALACGVPAVATDLTVHREVAATAALYVPVDAPDPLADALWNVLSNEELAQRLRHAARERAAQFSWTKSAEQHLEVYRLAAYEP
ncbi:glycosyltransferase family 1 protein [Thermomicrobium sp. 4228-Ro]|uniref:glycosyltransferase family 4 protein n=1 Tax=Thermomicrobium sp. 4228-Ro TaxID=2993937 RepID=UPI0022497C21|nr:glycosyltransferase family 1 protein [Thermomicrobium sp. 4228-Ro]MCX2726075.1 glycosyltransferase family 1 protein [Thermomicrobium sp. 4228-Ro]